MDQNFSKIWVIGGSNIDLNGIPENNLIDYDSNIGKIGIFYGGVGRNIAETSSLLGSYVNFVTVFSTDSFGSLLYYHSKDIGINLDYSIITNDYPTSIYIALMDSNGELRLGMNDMRILSLIDKNVITNILSQINPNDYLVIDSNLSEDLIKYIADNAKCKITSDPVSVNKIKRLECAFQKLSIFKVNKIEAEFLTGIKIIDDDTAKENIRWFLDKGVSEIMITLSGDGIYYGSDKEISKYIFDPLEVENPTGAGDAFFGAYLSERSMGMSHDDCVNIAIGAAALKLTLNQKEYIKIDEDKCNTKSKEMNIRKHILT